MSEIYKSVHDVSSKSSLESELTLPDVFAHYML